jgi:hypothetical protein
MVEIFFGIITRQAIRRGTFTSVQDLIAAIETFIDGWNDDQVSMAMHTKNSEEGSPYVGGLRPHPGDTGCAVLATGIDRLLNGVRSNPASRDRRARGLTQHPYRVGRSHPMSVRQDDRGADNEDVVVSTVIMAVCDANATVWQGGDHATARVGRPALRSRCRIRSPRSETRTVCSWLSSPSSSGSRGCRERCGPSPSWSGRARTHRALSAAAVRSPGVKDDDPLQIAEGEGFEPSRSLHP